MITIRPITKDPLTTLYAINELSRRAVDGSIKDERVLKHKLANTSDSSAIASTNTATNFSVNRTLSYSMFQPGRVFNLKANGVYSTTGTPTLTFQIRYGSTVLLAFSAKTGINNASNQGWAIEADLVVRSTGASGTLMCAGTVRINTSAGVDTIETVVNNAATTVDTLTTANLQVNLTWSANSASNTSTLKSLIVSFSDYP